MERMIEVGGLSDELLSRLDERASQIGIDRSSYVRRLIERAVAPPAAASTLAELLAPLHDYTEARRLSDDEIEQFFSNEITQARRDRRRPHEGGRPTR